MLFGAIALLWHDPDTWQNLRRIWTLPFGATIGNCLMISQMAGGVALQFPATARLGSLVLGAVYLFFSVICIPSILSAPAAYVHYGSFFEQFSLFCGALAARAPTETNRARAAAFARQARLGLAFCAISFALSQIFYLRATAALVPAWIPPNQMFWAILTTIAFALAGVAILIHRQAQLALRLMTLMLALFGVGIWIPLLLAHPDSHLNWSEFSLTFLITGAAWLVADLRSF